jgi:hypothetical protein
MEDVGSFPPAAAAAPPDEEDMNESPAASAQTGQLRHKRWVRGYFWLPSRLMQMCSSLICACVCIGAPHVLLCSAARKDSSGWPACELCGRRLSTCKGKLYQHGPGKICKRCYNTCCRSSAALAFPQAPGAHLSLLCSFAPIEASV